jgi:hypothetical protein
MSNAPHLLQGDETGRAMVSRWQSAFWFEILKRRDYLEDPGVDGKIISEWVLGKKE